MSETDDLTGAERYLAERLADPEYRAACEAAAPVTGDDLRERIARAAAGGYMRVPIVALDGMFLGPPWVDVADAVLAVLPPQPAPSPVPPWPGAVLSGLCDEDGEPTWLAQAGQVPGEQVRQWHGDEWLIRGYLSPRNWVEVRAPRAVPEPETERVNAFDAVLGSRRVRVNGKYVVTCNCIRVVDDGEVWVGEFGTGYAVVAPDGTVEVLKDGDR